MRIKALLVLSALAASATAVALPASAQGVVRSCHQAKQDNQVGGMILGGILGGVLGSNVAASGHKGDGTAVGAVLGGLVGSGIGADATRCGPQPSGYGGGYGGYNGYGYPSGSGYNDNPNYGGPYYNGYGGAGYGGYSPSPYSAAPADIYPYDAGAPQYRYGDDVYRDRDTASRNDDRYRLDRDRDGAYSRNDDYAGTDCSEATQVTRLPDGSEIHRPVQVCRDAHYGDWQVKD